MVEFSLPASMQKIASAFRPRTATSARSAPVAARQFLQHHGGRAHHRDRYHQRVVVQRRDIQHRDRAGSVDRLLGHQPADKGVAAAASAQKRTAQRDRGHVGPGDPRNRGHVAGRLAAGIGR
jgi:hypothetical protein